MNGIVIIPTYNERDNLPVIVDLIRKTVPELDILVVDDNSPDGTGALAEQLSEANGGKLQVLHRTRKEGLGRAYVHAFQHVLEQGKYDFLVHMDADLSHDPTSLPTLISGLDSADVVVGSRYMNGGVNVVGWNFRRLLLSKFASRYVRTITGLPLSDTTSGYRCWKLDALRELGLHELSAQGYLILVEMAYWAFRKGFRLQEVPIIFHERRAGASKVSNAVMRESALGVLALRFRFRLKNARRRALRAAAAG